MLDDEVQQKVAIISDAFMGIMNDATRAALVTDEEMEKLLWIDEQLDIKDDEKE